MKVKKTVQGGIVNLTNIKERLLNEEFRRLQELLGLKRKGLDFLPLYDEIKSKLYSANVQQALRYYKNHGKGKKYPISIRKDLSQLPPAKAGGLWLSSTACRSRGRFDAVHVMAG